jgi:hydroxymethylbilane synthase
VHNPNGDTVRQTVRIASRGSDLALWQAHHVRDLILRADPTVEVEIQVVHTTGDRITDVPLSRIGDRGLFTKEIDITLLEGRADLAVHSLKDVPTELPAGLVLAVVTEREDPRDVLLCRPGLDADLDSLPEGARVGTSSLRRRAQLRARRPDLEVIDLRGNLNTRLARLDAGDYDAIVLAAAGVIRLGWRERVTAWLEPRDWLPAVGQGALALVIREGDAATRAALAPLHHAESAACVVAERTLLHALEGGCQIPIGALATVEGETLHLDALVAGLDGTPLLRAADQATPDTAAELGARVAGVLLRQGARDVLASIRTPAPIPAP